MNLFRKRLRAFVRENGISDLNKTSKLEIAERGNYFI